jgi:hypothetical protein
VGRSGRVHRLARLWFAGFEPAIFGEVALVHGANVTLEIVDAEEAHPAAGRKRNVSGGSLFEVIRG